MNLDEYRAREGMTAAPTSRLADSAPKRYSITQVHAMIATLDAWIESSEEALDNTPESNYERATMLENRLAALNDARDALGDIE